MGQALQSGGSIAKAERKPGLNGRTPHPVEFKMHYSS
jgi:hypothetical protein